jgi:hypothetical protein
VTCSQKKTSKVAVAVYRMHPSRAQAAKAARNKFSRSHDAVIRVYDETGNVIETHEHKGDFKEW